MQLYFEKTKELLEAPVRWGEDGLLYSDPIQRKGVYEYRKPEINPETQTLDGIIVVDDIATNVIIPYPNWLYSDCHCRIWAKKSDCDSRKGGVLADFTQDLTSQMYIASKDSSQLLIKDGTVYYLFYASFLEKSDGFYLNNGIINNDSPQIGDKITIEQYTSFSESGDLLTQDDL